MVFYETSLTITVTDPLFSTCGIWGADFVTWIWLYICGHLQRIRTCALPQRGCLGVWSTHLWSGASLGGVHPSAHFLSLQSCGEASGDGGRGGPQWGRRKEWWMHKGTCGFICTSKNRTILYSICAIVGHTNMLLNLSEFQILIQSGNFGK